MKSSNAYAIILAGGNGERFWPLSTPKRPKQFLSFFGGKPLILQAVERLNGLFAPEKILIITAQPLKALTHKILPMIPSENIIGEPCRRDTAAAIAVACGIVKRYGGDDAVGCVLTADQLISPISKFQRVLRDAIKVAAQSKVIVTLGIKPTYPANNLGYIEKANALSCAKVATKFYRVQRFVEKPDTATAKKYLASGKFCWNSGMFIWQVATMRDAFAKYAPDIGAIIDKLATVKPTTARLKAIYSPLRAISVDYAVMEHAQNIVVANSEFDWDDVGSWLAIPKHFRADTQHNTCVGKIKLLEVKDTIAVNTKNNQPVAIIGLSNVVVVNSDNGILVCSADKLQLLKQVLKQS